MEEEKTKSPHKIRQLEGAEAWKQALSSIVDAQADGLTDVDSTDMRRWRKWC